jgi:hypothetical protein
MIVYGIALLPLSERLRAFEPTVLQPWYADDMAMVGPCSGIAKVTTLLARLGPLRGYFPEPSKSILICKPAVRDLARQALASFDFKYVDGHRYVGGFIGTDEAREAWLEPQLDAWVYGIQQLAKVAVRFPQTAFAGLAKSLQSEWMYLQRVIPDAGPAFAPLEAALATPSSQPSSRSPPPRQLPCESCWRCQYAAPAWESQTHEPPPSAATRHHAPARRCSPTPSELALTSTSMLTLHPQPSTDAGSRRRRRRQRTLPSLASALRHVRPDPAGCAAPK